MMNDQDLDRLIDRAAEQMVGREPSSALTHAVMARVREPEGARPSRRFVWAAAGTCAAAACALIAVVMLNRVPTLNTAPPEPTEAAGRSAVAPIAIQPRPPQPIQNAATVLTVEQPGSRGPRTAPRPAAADAAVEDDTFAVIDPIDLGEVTHEPIKVGDIDVTSVSFDQLVIEPLVIEPLSASND